MKTSKILGLMVASALLFASCEKEEPQTGYTISVEAGKFTGKTSAVTLSTGFVEVNEVELEFENDTVEIEVDIEGVYVFDLMTGVSNPAFPVAQIPAGTYHELEIAFGKNSNDTSLYLTGAHADSAGVATNFEITIIDEFSFELEDETNGINIDPNTVSNLSVYMDIEKILEDLDWSSMQLTNGNYVINDTLNETHYDAILNALDIEVELDEDDD